MCFVFTIVIVSIIIIERLLLSSRFQTPRLGFEYLCHCFLHYFLNCQQYGPIAVPFMSNAFLLFHLFLFFFPGWKATPKDPRYPLSRQSS